MSDEMDTVDEIEPGSAHHLERSYLVPSAYASPQIPDSPAAEEIKKTFEEKSRKVGKASKRMRWFAHHLIAYLAVAAFIVPLDHFYFQDERTWFLIPVVGWGGVLAIHARFAMEPMLNPDKNEKTAN